MPDTWVTGPGCPARLRRLLVFVAGGHHRIAVVHGDGQKNGAATYRAVFDVFLLGKAEIDHDLDGFAAVGAMYAIVVKALGHCQAGCPAAASASRMRRCSASSMGKWRIRATAANLNRMLGPP